MSTEIYFRVSLVIGAHQHYSVLFTGDVVMWLVSNPSLRGLAVGPTLASTSSHQALHVRLPQLDKALERAANALETYQTRPAQHRLEECGELATHVLDPVEGDELGIARKSALNTWYRARLEPFIKSYQQTHHKGVTVQDRLIEEFHAVIYDFRRDVYDQPMSSPPSDHPSSVSRDFHVRPTLRPERSRSGQLEKASTLSGSTLRLGVQEMRWSKQDSPRDLYSAVESRLKMQSLKNLLIQYDGNPMELRGVGLLLLTELRVRLPESIQLLNARHIMILSIPDSSQIPVYRRLYYDENEQKFKLSDEESYA